MNAQWMKRAAVKTLVLISLIAVFSHTGMALSASPGRVSNASVDVHRPIEEVRVVRRPAGEQRASKAAKMAAQYWRFKLQAVPSAAIGLHAR